MPTRGSARLESLTRAALSPTGLPSLESRGTERSASLSASAAMRRLRSGLQPCKHCAASARRKNSGHSPLFFLAEFLEGGIGAQRVPERIEPKKGRHNGRAVKPANIWRL